MKALLVTAAMLVIKFGITGMPIHNALMINKALMTDAAAEPLLKEC